MAKEIQFSYSGIFPKEASNSTDGDSIVDIVEGKEPGCCRDSIIVAGDSYDDIASFINPVKRSDKIDDDDATDEDRLINILREKRPGSRKVSGKVTIIDDQLNEISLGEPVPESSTANSNSFAAVEELEVGCGSDGQQSSLPLTTHNEDRNSVSAADFSGPDWHCEEWRQHRKHVFILSCSGKPIYTRYGDADQQASLFGTLLTLSQFLQHSQNNQSNKDVLRCVFAGPRRIVFVPSDLMVMVIVSHSAPGQLAEPTHSLVLQLTYVYNQIVSVLSLSRLKAVYEQRPNFDLRRLLSGSEKFIDSLLKVMDADPGFLLCSVKCLPLENSVRESIAQNIFAHTKIKDLVFAVLITGGQLVALVRMKQFLLHPIDLHILFNLVDSSESFKQAESWTPVCLPKFDPNGYLHCHISYLDDDYRVCLLLLSVNKDTFYTLSECRKRIRERLIKSNSLQSIKQALTCKIKDSGIPELLHFIYKARSTGQFIESDHACPYDKEEERERLFSIFRYVFCLMHTPGRRLKIYYHSGDKETVLGWITSGFELFAVFGPFTSKNSAIQLVNKLLKWIKKEENKFFILNSHTF